MKFMLEIVPGESIGPFRLGMTFPEFKEALLSFPSDKPVTLENLGIVGWSRGKDGGWKNVEEEGRCLRLGIRVYNNTNEIFLMGQVVNNISNEDAIRLFESFAGELTHSYGGFESVEMGIDAVRWENSDPWIDSIFVSQ